MKGAQINLLTKQAEPPPDASAPSWSRNTPGEVLSVVRRFDAIRLDPCSNRHSIVRAAVEWFGPPDGVDGLRTPWKGVGGPGIVYWNCPWHHMLDWGAKAHREWIGSDVESIGWSHFDPSTEWCQFMLGRCTAAALWRKRINHPCGGVLDKNGSQFPNAAWLFSDRLEHFKRVFEAHSMIVRIVR